MHRMVIRNKGEFLKKQLIEDFREAVSSSKIFAERDDLVHKYNLTCTVVDRIDSSIDILNNYSNALPTKEEEVVLFMVYACMLKDGIYALYEKVFQKKPPCIDNKKYFINVSNGLNNIYTVETCPTDDVFFEYYRALVFAHPFDTRGRVEKRCFIKENEIQLSPWVIPYKSLIFCVGISDPIGIRIYSNKNEKGLTDIYFSFENLKKYIQERYDYLIELTEWAKREVINQNAEWGNIKIDRTGSDEKILQNAIDVMKRRFEDVYGLEELIGILNCKTTILSNEESVKQYRDFIHDKVPLICDSIDNLDYERLNKLFDECEERPTCCPSLNYQLEKIFSYLKGRKDNVVVGSDEEWGLIQVEQFINGFAKKWVVIKPYEMDYDEIKLLVRTACYLEWRNLNK